MPQLGDNGLTLYGNRKSISERAGHRAPVYEGNFGTLDDWEKHSRLGLEADDLQQVIARWPNLDDRDENGNDFLAINNCMNEVCNGFQIASVEWSSWFDTPMSEIKSTCRKWLLLKGTFGGIR
jgi:hypothetical protein